ncbi:hypothetical protein H8D04_00600 [bacterium]|nr:hypothetical protein [bacterium]
MDDLLKDAIADAKAVRETALANAKIALEEAFTPRIQSMLSQKIQSEMEGEEEVPAEDEVEAEEEPEVAVEPEVGEEEFEVEEDDIDPSDEFSEEEPVEDEDDVIEINGVKYAPIVSEEDEEEFEAEPELEEGEEEDELDLEAILRELEDDEEELEEDYDEAGTGDGLDSTEVETADEAELAEDLQDSSEIGAADNKVDDDSNDSSDIGAQGPEGEGSDAEAGKEDDNLEIVDDLVEVNGVQYAPIFEDDEFEEDEEDIDLEEILRALSEGDEDEEEESAVAELESVKSDLKEHRNVVKYLRSKLNEVNLLNAKLLFTNKLFRSYGLNNNQKLKVVETFDRARNLREVKLVFSTLAESFGNKPSKTTTIKESKGSASKAVASTKPKSKKVIGEGFDMKNRFQKLANIL